MIDKGCSSWFCTIRTPGNHLILLLFEHYSIHSDAIKYMYHGKCTRIHGDRERNKIHKDEYKV